MNRRRYLVAYDISDDKRWRAVYDVVRSHGERLQYSVYLCDLTPIERIGLLTGLRCVINHRFDRVAIVDLGEVSSGWGGIIEFHGQFSSTARTGPSDPVTSISLACERGGCPCVGHERSHPGQR